MRFGIKAKEAVAISALTFLAVATATLVHLSQLSRVVVREALEQSQLIARQVYAQSRRALARAPGRDPRQVLKVDRDLRSLLHASVGYSPHLLYVLIADRTGRVVLGSEGEREGADAPERPNLQNLLSLDPVRRFRSLYAGETIYEVAMPIKLNDEPFGNIKLGVSTTLLRRELKAFLGQSVALAGVALPVAWLVAMGLAGVILKPIRALTLEMDRLRRGEPGVAADLVGKDEVGELASQIQLLGRQIQSDRLTMLSEKARLQQVVDHLEDGIVFLNQDGEILFYNRATEAVVGRPLEQAVGSRLAHILDPSHPLHPLLERSFERKTGFRNATIVVPGYGKPQELLVSHFFVSDAQKTMGSMILLKNLGSIKTLQSLISYSAKLAALGSLTSGVAHEVKNPLNAMMIHLELLKEKLAGSPEEVQDSLEVIRGEIRRLDRVVQGFLKFMRPHDLSLRLVDLNRLLREVTALLKTEWERSAIHFELKLDSSLPPVTADEELLRQVFLNIVLNACQSMPAGGTVSLVTEGEKRQEECVTVRIIDEGIGISPEDLEKVFKLYYTTKPEGSGIGLSLAYRIVQMHDGAIDVFSEVGKGTTVVVRFPAKADRS
ncbi:MAG: PAS domain-containing protein [Candidatus Tectomicrobia bacterium]|uniref:histidine kinase n=1 Tax=Tectimicrobiota bacterium TaxID=2528274 RepID=A0A932GRC1_UNCTE|nr:PAS domain-containing protein [Candidatus Tectomicrobia bacterium]